jgi:hypothetical protein
MDVSYDRLRGGDDDDDDDDDDVSVLNFCVVEDYGLI